MKIEVRKEALPKRALRLHRPKRFAWITVGQVRKEALPKRALRPKLEPRTAVCPVCRQKRSTAQTGIKTSDARNQYQGITQVRKEALPKRALRPRYLTTLAVVSVKLVRKEALPKRALRRFQSRFGWMNSFASEKKHCPNGH